MDDAIAQEASVKPLGLAFIIVMALLTWTLPRRNAWLPLFVTTCYMPLGQAFVIAGLHFQFFRILLLVGVVRVFSRGEHKDVEFTDMDRIFRWWAGATLISGTLASPSLERLINRCGETLNPVAAYFLFRCWVTDLDSIIRIVRFTAILILPMAVLMLVEKFTSHNVFSIFGGVPEITAFREGKLRCQGAFRHPILAGTYGATLFPLIVGLWFLPERGSKWPPILGACGSMAVTLAAASSGAMLAVIGSVIGLSLWPLRCHMTWIRRGFVAMIIVLSMVMAAPVWFLIARMSDITGGTGWHRSYLIDQAIKHFGEWWMVGSTYTANWAPGGDQILIADPNNMDITNQYIYEGLGGGLIKLGLFIALIVKSFKIIGSWTHDPEAPLFSRKFFLWSMGVCLIGHCVSFLSVVYFDQIIVMWCWLLASMSMLGARSLETLDPEASPDEETVEILDGNVEVVG